MAFPVDPRAFTEGSERDRALLSLRAYSSTFDGGWFDRITATTDPYVITGDDIAAVSTLSVDIPGSVIGWLYGEGRTITHRILREISPNARIWDDDIDLTRDGPAWRLWSALHRWTGMGQTKTSKLLAAKRPHLIPIQDSVVSTALGIDDSSNAWDLWHDRLSGADGEELRNDVVALRREGGVDPRLSVLRTIDIVIWMRAAGWRSATSAERFAGFERAVGAE